MRCEKVKKLILADYMDGELNEHLRKEVKDHLGKCEACRQFETRLESTVIGPLRGSEHVKPPEAVWANIKSSIEQEEPQGLLAGFRDRLRPVFVIRRPAFAVVSLMILVLVSGIFAGKYFIEKNALNDYMAEQVDFYESLYNGDEDVYGDIGIPMEDVFL